MVSLTERLSHLAMHDPLTNLPNRVLLIDRLNQATSNAMRSKERVAVLFLDLDGFKRINDSLGHARGDDVLKEVALRLLANRRSGDTIARWGGDEFVIVMSPETTRGFLGKMGEYFTSKGGAQGGKLLAGLLAK